jgi:hypothetical protein
MFLLPLYLPPQLMIVLEWFVEAPIGEIALAMYVAPWH